MTGKKHLEKVIGGISKKFLDSHWRKAAVKITPSPRKHMNWSKKFFFFKRENVFNFLAFLNHNKSGYVRNLPLMQFLSTSNAWSKVFML